MGDMKGWIVGQGMIIDMGHLSAEEASAFNDMSADARKQFIDQYIANYPDAYKLTAGFCAQQKAHVKESECVNCGLHTRGYKTMAEWEVCRKQNLSRI